MKKHFGRLLLKWYQGALGPGGGTWYRQQAKSLLRLVLLRFGFGETIRALEFHGERRPFREGRGFVGYLDSLLPVGEDGLLELRGWLLHKKRAVLAVTLFGPNGAPSICDYGLIRLDLLEVFPHLACAPHCGFRTLVKLEHGIENASFTFQAILSDESTRFGSFEPVMVGE